MPNPKDSSADEHGDTIPWTGPKTLGSIAPGGPTFDESQIAEDGPRYEIDALLGRGGMGEVWRARDERIGREVAVKILTGDHSNRGVAARFVSEARVQARLEHPAIVPVHDIGVDPEGRPYFVMKRIEGATLADVLASRNRDPAIAMRWSRTLLLTRFVDVCQAIAFAHQRGVVHRDLKPGNIMLGDFGEVYVLDWGLARVTGIASGGAPAIRRSAVAIDRDSEPTELGAILGTPGYMAPEHVRGNQADRAADIYALGCILFEVLTGRSALPHGADALGATLEAQAHRPRLRVPDANVPPELDDLCAAATVPEPNDRLASAEQLAGGIQRYLDGDRDLARRQELAAVAVHASRSALQRVGTTGRAEAMREAGRALALDPASSDAQALLAYLLLERPAELPPEVEAEVQHARVVSGRVLLRTAIRTNMAYFAAAPLLLFASVRAPGVLVVIAALLLADSGLLAWGARQSKPIGRMLYVALGVHCLLLASTAVLFSPFLVLPALAAISVTAFLVHPARSKSTVVVVAHVLALVVPLVLELVGVLPRTFTMDHATLAITPWVVVVSAPELVWIVTVFAAGQLATAAMLVRQLRRAEESAQRDVHVNAWHLRQLLPKR